MILLCHWCITEIMRTFLWLYPTIHGPNEWQSCHSMTDGPAGATTEPIDEDIEKTNGRTDRGRFIYTQDRYRAATGFSPAVERALDLLGKSKLGKWKSSDVDSIKFYLARHVKLCLAARGLALVWFSDSRQVRKDSREAQSSVIQSVTPILLIGQFQTGLQKLRYVVLLCS
ncbi:hypothetical protein RRG08_040295 [Elysia crispata]|uniref:Uncharacterized protein n=1 Tax=Elysia crispata TaxID=231223 RepID=A0AAE0Z2C6_9GAST|nr:hypothetical protein RRG08_040295 [Elysia crispata]